ncbi:MAG TPA: methyltransferase domain-containing protein [Solirubrobacteraceae bacterium]
MTRVFRASEGENRRVIFDAVARGPRRRRLLDLGCHDGAFTIDLARAARAEQVTGVELLEEHAARARARGVEVVIGDVNAPLPFAEGAFDLVHANQIIEHLRSTDGFMREVARVCAPDGLVVLSTNNLSAWHNVASLVAGYQPMPNHVSDEVHVGNPLDPRRGRRHADIGQTHLRVFTTRALVELGQAHRLELVGLRMNGYYPFPPRIARVLARVDPLHAAFIVAMFRPTPRLVSV